MFCVMFRNQVIKSELNSKDEGLQWILDNLSSEGFIEYDYRGLICYLVDSDLSVHPTSYATRPPNKS